MHKDTTRVREWRNQNPKKRIIQVQRYRLKKKLKKYNFLPDTTIKITDKQIDHAIQSYNDMKQEQKKKLVIQKIVTKFRHRARRNSKRGDHEFDLNRGDIPSLPEFCPYLKTVLDYSDDPKNLIPDENKPSIDRIDSSKGYVKGNIQIMSKLANQMKSKSNKEQLINFAKQILLENSTNS